jgi:hypothetical protein
MHNVRRSCTLGEIEAALLAEPSYSNRVIAPSLGGVDHQTIAYHPRRRIAARRIGDFKKPRTFTGRLYPSGHEIFPTAAIFDQSSTILR